MPSPFPRMALVAGAPFDETLREMLEMLYLWDRPIGLDGSRLEGFLGAVPATPLVAALRESLASLGCLPAPAIPLPARAAFA